MILRIHSDVSYLSVTKARSRATGFFYMLDDSENPHINGDIYVILTILKNVIASAAEAETGVVFLICQDTTSIRHALAEMDHPQPPPHPYT